MIPPIGILAAWTYYQQGAINIKVALLIAAGFFLGGLIGAKLAIGIPEFWLKKIFGVTMLLVALKMIFSK
jgi:uncharacterized membrane protein YfcA